jgi:hypothetical protein
VFKALELIEFADLIPPPRPNYKVRLRPYAFTGRTRFQKVRFPYQLIFFLFSVFREQAKNKKGSPAGIASGSSASSRNKSGGSAQRGRGKERMTKDVREDGAEAGPNASAAPLPNALDALSPETQSRAQVGAPVEAPTANAEMYPAVEQDDGEGDGEGEGEGEGDGDDEDQTEPEPEPEADEAEEGEDLDLNDGDEDTDMQVDADMREDRDDIDDDME